MDVLGGRVACRRVGVWMGERQTKKIKLAILVPKNIRLT